MINLRQLSPMELVERMIFCQNIKEIGANKIYQTDKKHHVFIDYYEDGTFELNWEFILFEATLHQFDELFKCFIVVNPMKPLQDNLPPKSNIILES